MEIVTPIVVSFVDGSLLWERGQVYIYIYIYIRSYATIPGKEDFKKEARFEAMADNRRKGLPWIWFYRKKLAEYLMWYS